MSEDQNEVALHIDATSSDVAAPILQMVRGELTFGEAIEAVRRQALEDAAKVAEDEDGHFTHWRQDRNSAVAQITAREIAAAIRALAERNER